jgi:hypothetical protein
MDCSKLPLPVTLLLILIFLISPCTAQLSCCFDRIFGFGDSMADTGNAYRLVGGNCRLPPYGETYFHKPNGRWCDGRVIVDFIGKCQNNLSWPHIFC